MRRLKANGVIAILLGASILLGSIGHVVGREGNKAYDAPDLMLTQGQAEYDLLSGIKYNHKKYELSVWDEGRFDINTPGSYTVGYLLTPIEADGGPKETLAPKDPAGLGGTLPPETSAPSETAPVPESTAPSETAPVPESTAPSETAPVPESTAPSETAPVPESTAPSETAPVPETSAPSETAPVPESSAPSETAPAPPETAPAPESQAPSETAPEPQAPPETAGTPESEAPQAPAGSSGTPQDTAKPADNGSSQKSGGSQDASARDGQSQEPQGQSQQDGTADNSGTMTIQGKLNAPVPVRAANERMILREGAPSPEEATPSEPDYSDPETATPSQPDFDGGEIYFTRTIVVKAAVLYQDSRYDINTVTDLLTDMDYDQNRYSLTVMDDGGFNGSRIGEYHIIYNLTNLDNGSKVADLERYIWITAPGVTFDAPDLQLLIDQQNYDLQQGIDYDSDSYTLETVNPESVDTSQAGEQRVMFTMTALTEESGDLEASPSQADSLVLEGSSRQEISVPEDSSISGDLTGAGISDGSEESKVSLAMAASESKALEVKPVAAIFGRNVRVGDGPVVVIDAPPLVVTPGTEMNHSLLEGVTAEDEDGNPVALQVANRSQLDQAAMVAAGGQEPDQAAGRADFGQAAPDLSFMQSLFLNQPDVQEGNNLPGTVASGATASEAEGQNTIPQESPELPAGLPPGAYTVLLSAKHPVTGEVFTARRLVRVGYTDLDYNTYTTNTYNVKAIHFASLGMYIPKNQNVVFNMNESGKVRTSAMLRSSIVIEPNSTLTINLKAGVTITVNGENGTDGNPASGIAGLPGTAGISLRPPGPGEQWGKLIIQGEGQLIANGGTAGNGGSAQSPARGGGGGGGAGAAIGGNGGAGGKGGTAAHPEGGAGEQGVTPPNDAIQIANPAKVQLNNGYAGSNPPLMVRNGGAAPGGGGMPATAVYAPLATSWSGAAKAPKYGGGAGGGGGGIGNPDGGGGFGQGYNNHPGVKNATEGRGAKGGICPYWSGTNVILSATGTQLRLFLPDMERALAEIQRDLPTGSRKNYTIALLNDYTLTRKDLDQLEGLGNSDAGVSVTLSGQDAQDSYNTKYKLTNPFDQMIFPQSADFAAASAFTIQDMIFKGITAINANGSNLTVGPGVSSAAEWTLTGATEPSAKAGLTVKGNDLNCSIIGTTAAGGHCTLTAQDATVNELYDCDTVNVSGTTALTINRKMQLNRSRQAGDITLEEGSKLTLPAYENKAQSLTTAGDGASLVLVRRPQGLPVLTLEGTDPANLTAHPVKLSYTDAAAAQENDQLLSFPNAKSSAKVGDYYNYVGSKWLLIGNPSTGMVQLMTADVQLIHPGGYGEGFASLTGAMQSIIKNNPPGSLKTGEYTVALLKDYTLNPLDSAAIKAAAGLSTEATVVITGENNQETTVHTLSVTAGYREIQLPNESAEVSGAAFRFQNIRFSGDSGITIVANGTKLTMGEGIVNDSSHPITVIGGQDLKPGDNFEAGARNTWLEVLSGNYSRIIGAHRLTNQTGQITQSGNTTVRLGGGARAGDVCGGAVIQMDGTPGAATVTWNRTGNSSITLSDAAAVTNLYSNCITEGTTAAADRVSSGSSQVLLQGGSVSGTVAASAAPNGAANSNNTKLAVASSFTNQGRPIGKVRGFETVELAAGSSLDADIIETDHNIDDSTYKFTQWSFPGNAHLTIRNNQSSAGSFKIEGTGNILSLPKPGGGHPGLTMAGYDPNVQAGENRLEIQYAGGALPADMDKLFHFIHKSSANKENYVSGFGGVWSIEEDLAAGDVYLQEGAIRLDYPAASGRAPGKYSTLGKTMEAIKADNPAGGLKSGIYTITLLRDYQLTEADKAGFAAAAGLSTETTVELTGTDALKPQNPVRSLIMDTDLTLPPGSAGKTGAAFMLRDITIAAAGSGSRNIAANGSKLIMGDGVVTKDAGGSPLIRLTLVGGKSSADQNILFEGNTWLEARSGYYPMIIGGNSNTWAGAAPTSTINGSTVVNISGSAEVGQVYGGSMLGGTGAGASVTQNGNRTVTIGKLPDGAAPITFCSPGSYSSSSVVKDAVGQGFTSKLALQDGAVVGSAVGTRVGNWTNTGVKLASIGKAELEITGSAVVNREVSDFETVRLTTNARLDVKDRLRHRQPFETGAQPAMLLEFRGGAQLILEATGNIAGSFHIAGNGNTLTIPRTGAGSAPMTLESPAPNTREGGARLQLSYPNNAAAQPGDKLLAFNPTKQNAVADDYMPESGGLAVLADGSSGYIYTGNTVTVEENGGASQFYPSLAKAMNAIGGRTGEFKVTFRKENYVLTPEDGQALKTQGGNTTKITYTSRFDITAADPLENNDTVGKNVTRTILVGYGTNAASPKFDLDLNSPDSVVENIKFKYLQEGCSLYSNGHTLLIGPNVEILSDNGYFPAIYGGAKSGQVGKTDISIQSGKFTDIYGGGREAGATVTGNASVKFGGDAVMVGAMYGGGEEGSVSGAASLSITGGKAMAADAATGKKNTVVGGGKNGTVGASTVEISGGTANGTIEIAGCDGGNVTGDVNIRITENPGSPAPHAPSGNIYGASLRPGQSVPGTVGGNIHITITNGKEYGAIHGGRSELAQGKTSEITLAGGSINVENIQDFDTFNIGDPDTGILNRANVYLTGKLQGGEGTLKFWDGSVLTLQGTSTAPEDLVINNIQTDDSALQSHLHMYKGPADGQTGSVSRPLHIKGSNTSAAENKLVLGEYGPGETHDGDHVGVKGDKLLVFDTPGNAHAEDYISDFQGLDIVLNAAEPGAVELGHSSALTIALKNVRHTDAAGQTTAADSPNTPVTKTLTFQIESYKDGDFTQPGAKIDSAYVDTSPTADANWAGGGDVPSGGTRMNVVQDPAKPIEWTGTATKEISPPAAAAPAYYYAHVRDSTKKVKNVILDVHSPVQVTSPEIQTDALGNYTFTVNLKDFKPVNLTDPNLNYNVSGLKQLAWAVGSIHDAQAGLAEALAPVMTEGTALKQVYTLDIPSIEDTYKWSFNVPAADLGKNPEEMAVYLYAKDAMGNTGVYPISMNGNVMDIEVPLWAGTVALRGVASPYLLAPNLYLVNRGEKAVKAELIGAEIPDSQELTLTDNKSGPWAEDELNLSVKSLDGNPGEAYFTSVKDLNTANPLNLGTMPGRNQANHGVGFSFGAMYDPRKIKRTGGWSKCVLTYRFSLSPPTPPNPPGP